MGVIYLVRHGQASFGAADYDVLSPLGHEQARLAGRELAARARRPLLVSGTLRRQAHTAALLGLPAAAGVVEDRRWNEYDHLGLVDRYPSTDPGDAGSPAADAATAGDSRLFQARLDHALARWIDDDADGGWDAFVSGATAALGAVAARVAPGQDAVVVTSGGVIAAVAGSLVDAPPAGVIALNRVMVNASITTVLAGSSGLSLLSFNEHAHLGPSRTYR